MRKRSLLVALTSTIRTAKTVDALRLAGRLVRDNRDKLAPGPLRQLRTVYALRLAALTIPAPVCAGGRR